MLLLSLALGSSLLLTSLALYALWIQRKSYMDSQNRWSEREREILDRLMFATGNAGYIHASRPPVAVAEDEPTETEWEAV